MFLFKKIISPLFFPLPLCMGLLLIGILLLWLTRRQRAGKIISTLAFALLILLSYGPVPNFLLRRLESKYQPVILSQDAQAPVPENLSNAKWIVVLGGGHSSDANVTAVANLSVSTLYRLIEAIELHRRLPGSRLLVSGSAIFRSDSEAAAMAKVAEGLGIDRQNIVLEEQSNDTEEQAVFIKRIVGTDPFILVTSASHMPRAVALFSRQGMNLVPAPTGQRVIEASPMPREYYPQPGNLEKSEVAVYEYLGLMWAKLRGKG
jgi:uncharacterized SAM-binding protein YcdF (DUF218 family)